MTVLPRSKLVTFAESLQGRMLLLIGVVGIATALDQLTKAFAVEHFPPPEHAWTYFYDTVRILYTENSGAFLGMGQSLSEGLRFWILTVVNAGLLLGILTVLVVRWNMEPPAYLAFSLLLGGGIGNQIDRVLRDGRVIDFLNVGIGPVRTGVFNFADLCITTGVVILLGLWFVESRARKRAARDG